MKIGVFGGSFNPPHQGHLNSLQTVKKLLGLDLIYVVPASQNPLKTPIEGPSKEQRLKMVKLAVETLGPGFEVDPQEIERGGLSYTIDTLRSIQKRNPGAELFLITGLDKLEEFNNWKQYEDIFKEANVIMTSRPGFDLPAKSEDLPQFLQEYVKQMDFNICELTTGKAMQFIQLRDVEASATELRKWLRAGKSIEKYIPLSVERFIKDERLYKPLSDRIGDFKKFTEFCASVLFARKAIQVRGFNLQGMSAPSDYALIGSGTSTKHAAAMAEQVAMAVKAEYGVHPQSVEGIDEGRWVLLDYGDLIIHIFYDYVRQEYSLENMWQQGEDLKLKES